MKSLKTLAALTLPALALAALATTGTASAADYPEKPITLIVPFAAGGSTDIVSRVVATQLGKQLKQAIVVENKPGADGLIGLGALANAAPDGYTILLSAGAETIGPALHRQLTYDPIKNVAPISELATTPNMIVVNNKVGAATLGDLVTKAKNASLNAAAAGNGSRLWAELFKLDTQAKIEIISYNSTGQATTALLQGESDFAIMDSLAFASISKSNAIKLLAVASDERLKQEPNVPTTTEAGMPQFKSGTVYGIYAPGGTPAALLDRLHQELQTAVAAPDVAAQFTKLNLLASKKSREDFQKDYVSSLALWKKVVAEANIKTVD